MSSNMIKCDGPNAEVYNPDDICDEMVRIEMQVCNQCWAIRMARIMDRHARAEVEK